MNKNKISHSNSKTKNIFDGYIEIQNITKNIFLKSFYTFSYQPDIRGMNVTLHTIKFDFKKKIFKNKSSYMHSKKKSSFNEKV